MWFFFHIFHHTLINLYNILPNHFWHYLSKLSLFFKRHISFFNLFVTPWTCCPPSSSDHGIFQARILEWVAISYSKGLSWLRDWICVSCIGRWVLNVWEIVKVAQSCPTLCNPHRLYSPWNSPGRNTGVGSHSILHGIFPTQGLKPGLPHCR